MAGSRRRKFNYETDISKIQTDKVLIKSPVGINEDLTGSMQLPSARYKYLKWTDLKGIDTKGSTLRSPRIRATPNEYKKASKIPLKNSSDVSRQEDWERSAVANFSYQELQHNYQSDALQSSLERFKDATVVRLDCNRVKSLNSLGSSLTFPKCRAFYAGKNHFDSFEDLPSMPLVEHVDLRQTNISAAAGIHRFPNLITLNIEECPFSFTEDFRGYLASQNKNMKLINNIAVTFGEQNFKPPKKKEKKQN